VAVGPGFQPFGGGGVAEATPRRRVVQHDRHRQARPSWSTGWVDAHEQRVVDETRAPRQPAHPGSVLMAELWRKGVLEIEGGEAGALPVQP